MRAHCPRRKSRAVPLIWPLSFHRLAAFWALSFFFNHNNKKPSCQPGSPCHGKGRAPFLARPLGVTSRRAPLSPVPSKLALAESPLGTGLAACLRPLAQFSDNRQSWKEQKAKLGICSGAAARISPHYAGKVEPVVTFLDVFNRSTCQPKETMVSLDREYPELLADHIVLPSCVLLKRCAGCCVDESLKCVPTQTRNVVMEVMLRKFEHGHVDRLTFEEHTECACRPRTFVRLKSLSSSCPPCLNRRKWLDPQTCQCSCRQDALRCQHRGFKVNEANCRCMHLRRPRNRKAKTVS